MFERVIENVKEREVKDKLATKKKLEQEMNECTFTPKIDQRRSQRAFQDFLKEQHFREAKKQKEISLLAAQKEESQNSLCQNFPSISDVKKGK